MLNKDNTVLDQIIDSEPEKDLGKCKKGVFKNDFGEI